MKISELNEMVVAAAQLVADGFPSQYINAEVDGVNWVIRVSNHEANNSRVDANTISFVIDVPVRGNDDDSYSAMSISKKQFRSFPNQFYVNSDLYDESGYYISELLENAIN